MNSNKNRLSSVAYLFVVVVCSFILNLSLSGLSQSVSALSVQEKSAFYQAYQCASEGDLYYDSVPLDRKELDSGGWHGIVRYDALGAAYGDSGKVIVGSESQPVINAGTCRYFFYNRLNQYGMPAGADDATQEAFLKEIGFEEISTNNKTLCHTFSFSSGSTEICLKNLSSDGKITSKTTSTITETGNPPVKFKYGTIDNNLDINYYVVSGNGRTKKSDIAYGAQNKTYATNLFAEADAILAAAGNNGMNTLYSASSGGNAGTFSGGSDAAGGVVNTVKTFAPGSNTPDKLLAHLGTNLTALKVAPTDKQELAQFYLNNYFTIDYAYGKSDCNLTDAQLEAVKKDSSYTAVNLGKGNTCYVKNGSSHTKAPGWNGNGYLDGTTYFDFADYLKVVDQGVSQGQGVGKIECNKKGAEALSALWDKKNKATSEKEKEEIQKQIDEMTSWGGVYWTEKDGVITCKEFPGADGSSSGGDTTYTPPSGNVGDEITGDNNDNSGDGEAGVTDGCYGEAGVLGWILCPVLRYVGQAANSIYEDVESTYLQVNPNIIKQASSGWTIFRNFANTIFAAMFVIVILSQITGFGISNYGIKKLLPRLIVVVVLVNVSFFLCEVAVDLSNILGYSFNQFFRKLGTDGGSAAVTMQSTTALILDIINGIGVGAGIAGVAFTIAEGGWLPFLVPLLIVAITVLIGIFFFFVVLAVRQVGIVILAVLSPVAIILYALPNTQKLFSKWLKIFADLLLVYPICGLLMGGSEYASRLLLSGDHEVSPMYYFVVLLLSVVPFFFIPSILRGSINGIAGLGNKLQGMGQKLGRTAGMRAGGGIMRSNWARTSMEEHQRNASEKYHTRRVKSLERNLNSGRGSEKSRARLQRRLTRSNAVLAKYHDEDMRSEAMGTEAYIPGSDRYKLAAGKFERAQDKLDVEAQEDVYKNGINKDADINTLGADESYVDVNNEDSLIREHGIQMRRLQSEVASGVDYTKTLTKVKALQNMLSETDSGRSAIESNMLKMAEDQITNNTMIEEGKESAFSLATAHLKDAHMGIYKQNNRSMAKMIQDFAAKDYSHIRTAGDIRSVANGKDSFKQDKYEYRSAYYGRQGLGGYTTESLANADDGALDRIINGIENNEFTGADIQTISSLANDALAANAKGVLPMKEDNRERLQKLAQGAYATGAVAAGQTDASGNVVTSTAGSQAISNASMASLEFINSGLQSGAISGDTATRIAENARAALQDPAVIHDPERSEMLNQILTTANSKGINQLEQVAAFNPNKYEYKVSGNTIQAVDSSSIKVRGATRPPKLKMQEMPNGWAQRNSDPHDNSSPLVWKKQDTSGQWVELNSDELKTVRAINRVNRDRQRQNAINGYDVEVPTPPPSPNP